MPDLFVVKNPNLITASVVGLAYEPTLDAPAGLTSEDGPDGSFLLHETGTAGGSAGVISGFDVLQWQLANSVTFVVKSDAGATVPPFGYGAWIGVFSRFPMTMADPAPPVEYAAFRIDDATGSVQTVTSRGGANPGVTVRGSAALVPGRLDSFRIEFDLAAGEVRFFWPQPATLYQTHGAGSFLPDPTTSLGYGVRVVATSNVSRGIRWKRIALDLE